MKITTSYRSISYDAGKGTGYAAISMDRGMTPWHFSTERAQGLWSLSAHVPGIQLLIIGPFRLNGGARPC